MLRQISPSLRSSKHRNVLLAKMASLQESKRSENKQCTAFAIFSENLTVFSSLIPKSGRNAKSHIFAVIFITGRRVNFGKLIADGYLSLFFEILIF